MFIGPAIVSLREGIEIALILAIMLSYLIKTKQSDLTKFVYAGALVAAAVSVSVALLLGLVWGYFEGPELGVFEGIVVIGAAVLLTTMIGWMWHLGASISSHIQESMSAQVTARRGLGLGLLALALILREGVELVLFTLALAIEDAPQTYLGVSLGLGLALVIGLGVYRGALRVDLKKLFRWTSVFLVLFAAGMVAYGVHELQEAGLLLIGPLQLWNINPPLLPDGSYPLLHEDGLIGGLLKALFGYDGNPSALEVVAYAAYLLLAIMTYLLLKRRERISSPRQSPQTRTSPSLTPEAKPQ